MAISIDATAGGSSANSFATLAEFTAYMEGRLNSSTFDDASADSQNRALVEATRSLNYRPWKGRQATDSQALAWPRYNVIDPDSNSLTEYSSSVVPDRVKDATCELAFQYLKAGTTDVAALDDTLNIKRDKVGPLETEYFEPDERAKGLARYPSVTRYLKGLVAGGGVAGKAVRA